MASATCPCGGTFSTGDPGPDGRTPALVHRDARSEVAPCPLEARMPVAAPAGNAD